jgi:pimeloyl-ACP methyl ester carboxylesterase
LPKLFAPGKHTDAGLAAHPTRGVAQAGVAGITWALEAMARRPDRTAILQKLDAPILIVHSTEDQFIPVDRIRQFAKSLPKADYVEIADAGHATPLEKPDDVAAALKNFLSKIPA